MDVFTEEMNAEVRHRLAQVVERHNAIIDFCTDLTRQFTVIVLMHFLSAAFDHSGHHVGEPLFRGLPLGRVSLGLIKKLTLTVATRSGTNIKAPFNILPVCRATGFSHRLHSAAVLKVFPCFHCLLFFPGFSSRSVLIRFSRFVCLLCGCGCGSLRWQFISA